VATLSDESFAAIYVIYRDGLIFDFDYTLSMPKTFQLIAAIQSLIRIESPAPPPIGTENGHDGV